MRLDTVKCFIEKPEVFWKKHWENNPLTGKVSPDIDPDNNSQILKEYNYQLYRRELPNGEFFDLWMRLGNYHLLWKDVEFGSDSIIVSFREMKQNPGKKSMQPEYEVVKEFAEKKENYEEWVKKYLEEAYTIGGEIIFPTTNSINQARGRDRNEIADRFDITLLCIQYHYENKTFDNKKLNDFLKVLEDNTWFFDLFVSFKGYVDYFLLNDWVDENYNVKLILRHCGRPNDVKEYEYFMDEQMVRLRGRNEKIAELKLIEWPYKWMKKVNGRYVEY